MSWKHGKWSGPLLSSYGYHLVYVTKKENLSEPTLESIEEKLQSDYLEEKREQANTNFMNQLKKNYSVFYSKDLKAFADSINLSLFEQQ